MLPLFDEPVAPAPVAQAVERLGVTSPEYRVFWSNFRRGADGQSAPGVDADERIARYAKDGYRIGRLFRPLPCMGEHRG